MGNIINFMEKLGASAEFQELTETEVVAMLKQQDIAEDVKSEFLPHIEQLLDVRKTLICGLAPAEEPDETQTPDDEETPEDENNA